MKNLLLILVCYFFLRTFSGQQTHCEYLQNPLGVDVSVPAGSTASIHLPGKPAVEVGAGRFTYSL